MKAESEKALKLAEEWWGDKETPSYIKIERFSGQSISLWPIFKLIYGATGGCTTGTLLTLTARTKRAATQPRPLGSMDSGTLTR